MTIGSYASDYNQGQILKGVVEGEVPIAVSVDGVSRPLSEWIAGTVSTAPAGHDVTLIWRGTQAEYDALGAYSDTTLYVIVG